MTDSIYKTVELTGTSFIGTDDAVKNALSRASKTIRNLGWFEIAEIRGRIDDGQIGQWQVAVKAAFTLDGE